MRKKREGGVQGEKETGQVENESVRKARGQKKRRKNMNVQRSPFDIVMPFSRCHEACL